MALVIISFGVATVVPLPIRSHGRGFRAPDVNTSLGSTARRLNAFSVISSSFGEAITCQQGDPHWMPPVLQLRGDGSSAISQPANRGGLRLMAALRAWSQMFQSAKKWQSWVCDSDLAWIGGFGGAHRPGFKSTCTRRTSGRMAALAAHTTWRDRNGRVYPDDEPCRGDLEGGSREDELARRAGRSTVIDECGRLAGAAAPRDAHGRTLKRFTWSFFWLPLLPSLSPRPGRSGRTQCAETT